MFPDQMRARQRAAELAAAQKQQNKAADEAEAAARKAADKAAKAAQREPGTLSKAEQSDLKDIRKVSNPKHGTASAQELMACAARLGQLPQDNEEVQSEETRLVRACCTNIANGLDAEKYLQVLPALLQQAHHIDQELATAVNNTLEQRSIVRRAGDHGELKLLLQLACKLQLRLADVPAARRDTERLVAKFAGEALAPENDGVPREIAREAIDHLSNVGDRSRLIQRYVRTVLHDVEEFDRLGHGTKTDLIDLLKSVVDEASPLNLVEFFRTLKGDFEGRFPTSYLPARTFLNETQALAAKACERIEDAEARRPHAADIGAYFVGAAKGAHLTHELLQHVQTAMCVSTTHREEAFAVLLEGLDGRNLTKDEMTHAAVLSAMINLPPREGFDRPVPGSAPVATPYPRWLQEQRQQVPVARAQAAVARAEANTMDAAAGADRLNLREAAQQWAPVIAPKVTRPVRPSEVEALVRFVHRGY